MAGVSHSAGTELPSGRRNFRDMVLLELALAWNEDGVDLRKTAASVSPV